MRALEYEVLTAAQRWLECECSVYLCTIVKAVGSSPRPVGSLLACTTEGQQVGSLSGGCVEEDLLEKIYSGVLRPQSAQIVEYGVTAEENERLGLPCGGRLYVLIQYLDSSHTHQWLSSVIDALARRMSVKRIVNLETGETDLIFDARFQPLVFHSTLLQQSFGPCMRLLLIGAGQLSQSLAELAVAMDYEVIVTDPREEVLSSWSGPSIELVGGMPDDAVRRCASDKHSIVITLTHDPRIDDMGLMEALTTDAWYVGALGSIATTNKRLRRLRELDLSDAQLARLHAPVGLDIGSKTPLEIAVSIMAELTLLRRTAAREESGRTEQ